MLLCEDEIESLSSFLSRIYGPVLLIEHKFCYEKQTTRDCFAVHGFYIWTLVVREQESHEDEVFR